MMTLEQMEAALEALGNDVSYGVAEDEDGQVWVCVTLQDFEGFDENWREVMRRYDDPKAVERFLDMLESECVSQEGDFYVEYHFDGFSVEVGNASFDI